MSRRPGLAQIPLDALRLLSGWDLVAAGRMRGVAMAPDVLDQQWVWYKFAGRTEAAPEHSLWFTRYFAVEDNRAVAGRGLHFSPDESGEVTIGHQVSPTERRPASRPPESCPPSPPG